jgi:hypothetical protein
MAIKKATIPAKACYSHIGGKLGMMLMETFIEKDWIRKKNPKDKHFFVTQKGKKEFTNLGVDLSRIELEE